VFGTVLNGLGCDLGRSFYLVLSYLLGVVDFPLLYLLYGETKLLTNLQHLHPQSMMVGIDPLRRLLPTGSQLVHSEMLDVIFH
jgi:hypothetical protein